MLAQENGLLLRRELHHPEPILRVQAGEDAAVGAEVGMVHVRALGGAVEGQQDLAEIVGSHRVLSPRRGIHGGGRIGAVPGRVRGRTVGRRHAAIEQAQVDGQLRAMVRGVEDAAPHDPDALALDVEERHAHDPPGLRLRRQVRQPRHRQLAKAGDCRGYAMLAGSTSAALGSGIRGTRRRSAAPTATGASGCRRRCSTAHAAGSPGRRR